MAYRSATSTWHIVKKNNIYIYIYIYRKVKKICFVVSYFIWIVIKNYWCNIISKKIIIIIIKFFFFFERELKNCVENFTLACLPNSLVVLNNFLKADKTDHEDWFIWNLDSRKYWEQSYFHSFHN
jgi:hypothetical protein